MKKLIIVIALACIVFPTLSSAKSLAGLKIYLSSDIVKDCNCPPNTDMVGNCKGCFWYPDNIIYVDSGLSVSLFSFTLIHEIGHFLMAEKTIAELRSVYPIINPYFDDKTWKEVMANFFVMWVNRTLKFGSAENAFFIKLLK
jgi:hypothetical protein